MQNVKGYSSNIPVQSKMLELVSCSTERVFVSTIDLPSHPGCAQKRMGVLSSNPGLVPIYIG